MNDAVSWSVTAMIEVHVLGPIAARVHGTPTAVASRAQRAILAGLSRDVGRVVPTDRLVDLVWEQAPPAAATASLRSHVSRLRGTLTADVIAADRGGYALTVHPAQVDACRFEQLVEGAENSAALDVALALWRGEPFGEFCDHPFLAAESARLHERRLQARERRAAMVIDAGRPQAVVADLRAVVRNHPLRETAWVLLLRALDTAGRGAEAVAAAARFRQELAGQGLEPSPAFAAVEQGVFRAGVPPPGPVPPLPAPLDDLVGRDDELSRLRALLRRRRLVSLVGPGGVGKTTLAVAVARAEHRDAVWMVDLASVEADDAVIPALARATGAARGEPLELSVHAHLADRAGLVVLDAAEHVIGGVATAARLITGAGPELRVLVTTRRPLGVDGEVVVRVDPLAHRDAVTLFRARAADAGRPVGAADREMVDRLCARLDRLPLAIEMAAARLRSLPLETLTERLDDRLRLLRHHGKGGEARHRTLREVVGWSFDLLDREQRDLFVQLSVFAGSFSLEAAESVCRIGGHVDAVLADLVDHSLVRFDADVGRYRLLETVRQFAIERRGDARPLLRRHAGYHAGLAEQIGRGLSSADDSRWAELFDRHASDIAAAHRYGLSTGDVDLVARMSADLYVLVYQRLRADVGAWAAAALPHVQQHRHPLEPAVRAVVAVNLVTGGNVDAAADLLADLPDGPPARFANEVLSDVALYRGDHVAALVHGRRAQAQAQQAGDHFTAVFSLAAQALAHGYDGRLARGRELAARGAAAADTPLLAAWFAYAGAELRAQTEPRSALATLRQVVTQADDAGWEFLLGVALVTAGTVTARHADPHEALQTFEDLIHHWRRLGDATHQWTTLRNVVELLARIGAHDDAARLFGAVSRAPTPTYGAELRRLRAAEDVLRATLGDRLVDARSAEGRKLTRQAAEDLALAAVAVHRRCPPGG